MSALFQWDEGKVRTNLQKHRVSFTEAASVFSNPLAAVFSDPEHSQNEFREIIIGHSEQDRLLLVSFTERGEVVRIISARLATSRERKDYEDNSLGGMGP